MSSTSVCSYDDYDQNSSIDQNSVLETSNDTATRKIPFDAAVTQPLVYFSEVHPYFKKGRQGDHHKSRKNYFSRAFKWYTQDRQRTPVTKNISPELSGFATWLDAKYFQYQQENEMNRLQENCPPCSETSEQITRQKYAQLRSSPAPCARTSVDSSKKTIVKSSSNTSGRYEEHDSTKYLNTQCSPEGRGNNTATCNNVDTVETTCKSPCAYKTENAMRVELQKALDNIQNITNLCESTCPHNLAHSTVNEPQNIIKAQDPSQHPQTLYPQYQHKVQPQTNVKNKHINRVSCSCHELTKSKPKAVTQVASAYPQRLCDPVCPFNNEFKMAQAIQYMPTNSEAIKNTCDPACLYVPKYQTREELPNTATETVVTEVSNKPTCSSNVECKNVEETPKAGPKTVSIEAFCKPSCMSHVEYKTVEESQRIPSKTEMSREASYINIKDSVPAGETQTLSAKMVITDTSSKLTCKSSKHQTVGEVQRAPPTSVITDGSCKTMCTTNTEQTTVKETQNIPAKTVIAEVSCKPSCMPNTEYKTAEESQKTIQKPAAAENLCSPNCVYDNAGYKNSVSMPVETTYTKSYVKQDFKPAEEVQMSSKPHITCECVSARRDSVNKSQKNVEQVNQYTEYRLMPVMYAQCDCKVPSAVASNTRSKYLLISENASNTHYNSILVEKVPSKPTSTEASNSTQAIQTYCPCKNPTNMIDASCQYSVDDIIVKLAPPSRCEQSNYSYYYDPACVCAKTDKSRTACNSQGLDFCTTRNTLSMRKLSRSPSMFRSEGVQTSDHAISLENNTGRKFAFFMKIICADKPNDCLCDKSAQSVS